MKLCIACKKQFTASPASNKQHSGVRHQPLVPREWLCPVCEFLPVTLDEIVAFAPERADSDIGFKQDHYRKYAEIEKNNFWFSARNKLIIWALQHYFSPCSNFLELGSGNGLVLAAIQETSPAFTLTGSDIANTALQYLKQKVNNATLLQMDGRTIPFVDEFDIIGAFDMLEHIAEDEQVLQQMYQAVKPGGGIILTVPQHPFLWSQHDVQLCHVRRYTKNELVNKVSKAGFQLTKITSFVSLLLPFMIISRLFKHKSVRGFDCLAELQLPIMLNNAFSKILNLERSIIKLGFNLPVGGSLLLIAKKISC